MKNRNELIAALTVDGVTDWAKYRETVRTYRAALEDLKERVNNDRNENRTPAETIAAWVAAVGYDVAVVALSSAIAVVGEWDARISGTVRAWAKENGYDRESALDMVLFTDSIHNCHKNQLAAALMEYKPTEPTDPTDPAPAETAETAASETNAEPAHAYIISENPQFGSLEITFSEKPAETVREALKALKFRWNGKRGLWYGFADIETVKAAIDGREAPDKAGSEKPAQIKPAKVDKDALRTEFAKAWNSQRMIDFCTNKVAAVAVLPSGEIVTIDKQSIETRFCFGERGYDYDEAQAAARNAAQSQDYFRAENMRFFDECVRDLEDARDMTGSYLLTINSGCYQGQSEDCKLRSINFQRISKVIDDLGGSAFLADIPGQTITERGSGRSYRVATREEAEMILAAYKEARAAHEKKVNAYLKRYGMSKVDTWTYWIDA